MNLKVTIDYYLILVIFFISVFYLPTFISQYVLSGDDLFLLLQAPSQFQEVISKLTTFSGQYRPLTHSLFSFYAWLLSYSDTLVKVFHFALILFLSVLWYSILNMLVKKVVATLFTVFTFMNPILYYHIFAIASLNNLLILLFALVLLWVYVYTYAHAELTQKYKIWFFSLSAFTAFVSLFAKETFLPLFFLMLLIAQRLLSKRFFIISVISSAIILGFYGYIRVYGYVPSTSEYSFIFSFEALSTNIILFLAWLVGYPMGWQYAAADPKTLLTYIIPLLYTFLYVFAGYTLINQKKVIPFAFQGAISSILSLLPFLFLQRVLVFYLDFVWFSIVFFIVLAYTSAHSKLYKRVILLLFCFVISLQFFVYHPQWHRHSFVAHANTTAKNLLYKVKDISDRDASLFANVEIICIKNHSSGYWPTAHGRILHVYGVTNARVISLTDAVLPDECYEARDSVMLLENDGWEYKVYQSLDD